MMRRWCMAAEDHLPVIEYYEALSNYVTVIDS